MALLSHWTDRLRRLSMADTRLLLLAWWYFARVDLVIRTRPFAYWRGWLDETTDVPRDLDESLPIARVIKLSEWAARHHWAPMNCLRRCFVQRRLLARQGTVAQLRLGVRMVDDGRLQAHAWLTLDDQLLNDSTAVIETYQELRVDAWDELPTFS